MSREPSTLPKSIRSRDIGQRLYGGTHFGGARLLSLFMLMIFGIMSEFTSTSSESNVYQGLILQSFSDNVRKYRHITLGNGLEVMLVSHPGSDKASCCCSVAVGSMQDPEEYPGLAHFLEHLLFMGTAEYPKENEYMEFLSINGGMSNAYTAAEKTVYYYDVLSNKFEESLMRFASFFKCPLFNSESTEREMKAVHSENDKNLQSDEWRFQQMVKSLSRRDHPYNKFSTGNLSTLGSDNPDKARKACIEFHKKYYSSNVMKVCMYGKESLDQLQEWAERAFSGIVNQNCPAVQPVATNPYTRQELMRYIEVVPVKDERACTILFPLPAVEEPRIRTLSELKPGEKPLYHSNPIKYINHLLGHEGKGSILYALKEKNWATALSSYPYHSGSSFAILNIRIEFTDQGFQNLDAIVSCVFAYIGMLRTCHTCFGSQPDASVSSKEAPDLSWAPQELFDISNCNFRYRDEGSPANEAITIANDMHIYPIEHILSADHILYDIEPVQRLATDLYFGSAGGCNYFSVENSIVIVENKAFAGTTTQVERWYGTEYNEKLYEDINNGSALLRWQRALQGEDSEWVQWVHMPRPNDLLPQDFTLKHEVIPLSTIQNKSISNMKDPKSMPRVIEETDRSGAETSAVVWFQPDHRWGQPKCHLRVKLWVPALVGTISSAASFALGDLYANILEELLVEDLYYASCARLTCNATISRGALLITASGYSHKLQHLLCKVLAKMKAMAGGGQCSEGIFDRAKDRLLRSYKNKGSHSDAHQHAMLGTAQCMLDSMFHPLQKLAGLQTCTLAQFDAFCADIVQQGATSDSTLGAHVECFFIGNITEEESRTLLYDRIVPTLQFKPLCSADRTKPHVHVVSLSPRTEYIYNQHSQQFNPDETNSALQNIYIVQNDQVLLPLVKRAALGVDDRTALILVSEAFVTLLAHVMHEAAFNQLRTLEQLGYIVHVGQGNMEHCFFLRVIIQSSVKDATYLDQRVETFFRTWYRDWLCADDEDYSDLPLPDVTTPLPEEEENSEQETEADTPDDVADVGPKLQQDGIYDSFVQSLCEKILEPDHSLSQEAGAKWMQIDSCRYLFDHDELMVAALHAMTLDDFKFLYNTFIRATKTAAELGQSRRKFSSRFYGKGTTTPPAVDGMQGDTAVVHVADPAAFKAASMLETPVFLRK